MSTSISTTTWMSYRNTWSLIRHRRILLASTPLYGPSPWSLLGRSRYRILAFIPRFITSTASCVTMVAVSYPNLTPYAFRIKSSTAVPTSDITPDTAICGPAEYRAPELTLGHEWSTGVDIWSVGCMVFQPCVATEMIPGFSIFNGNIPF